MLLTSPPLLAQQAPVDSQRMVLSTGTVCHAATDESSPAAHRYHAGDIVHSSKSATGLGRRVWYFDSWQVMGISPTCWVLGSATVPYDPAHPDLAYAALVDHVLARTDTVSVAGCVEIENLLEVRNPYTGNDPALVRRFPTLRFRSLLLMDKILGKITQWSIADAPLERAWVIAHQDQLVYSEPDASWYVRADEFWTLTDQHKAEPWTEALAWAAAQRPALGDECGADCFLSMVMGGPQMYWARYPTGSHIGAALTLADTMVAHAITFGVGEEPPTRPMIERVRTSLRSVTDPGKAHVLELLSKLELHVK